MSDPELIKQWRIGFQEWHIIHSSDRNDYGHESSLFIALKYPVIHNDDASMDGLFHKGLSEKDVRMLYLSKNVKLQEKFNQYILGKVKAWNIDYKWLESIGDCLSLALLTECINHKDLYKNETADICLSMFYIVLTQTKDVSLRKLAVKKIFEIQPDSIRATHFLVYTSTMKLILSDNSFKEYHSLASLLLKMSESVDTREHYYD